MVSRDITLKETRELQNSGLICKFTQNKFHTRLHSAVLQMATSVQFHQYRTIESLVDNYRKNPQP